MNLKLGYLGWLDHGNLGDEAAFEVFARHMERTGKPYDITPFDVRSKFDLVVIGGGTLLSAFERPRDVLGTWLRENRVPYVILGTGIEELDPPLLENSPDFRDSGKGLALLADNLSGAEAIFLRDISSQEVAKVLLGVAPPVIGDLCYLSKGTDTFACASRTTARGSIALNVGMSYGNIYGKDEAYVVSETARAVVTMLSRGLSVTFFPVWHKDLDTQASVAALCTGTGPLHELPLFADYGVLVDHLRCHDLVIGMKLHSLVFAAIAATPMVAIAYREKCTAMMRTIGLERFALRTDTLELSSALVEVALEALATRQELSLAIRQRTSELAAEANRAIESFF